VNRDGGGNIVTSGGTSTAVIATSSIWLTASSSNVDYLSTPGSIKISGF
jgi:hypothetical protein